MTLLALTAWLLAAPPDAGGCAERLERVTVRGASMEDLAPPGAALLARHGHFACHPVQRGDLVLVSLAGRPAPLFKRVAVVPGDRFELTPSPQGWHLVVNGVPAQTPRRGPYRFDDRAAKLLRLYVTQWKGVVPPDVYLVFGTDPAGTLDSARFGPVTRAQLLALVEPPR